MGAIFSYSLTVSVFLLFGYLTYKIFLASEKQSSVNRIALLFIYVASVVSVPLLTLQLSSGAEAAAGGTIELGEIVINVVPVDDPGSPMLPRVLLGIYAAGVGVVLVSTLHGLVNLFRIVRKGERSELGEYTLVRLSECRVPFSFGRYIVVGSGEPDQMMRMIMAHEGAHLRYRHWIDLVIAQMGCVVMWYNPASWLMREEMRQVHEYQADEAVLAQGFSPYEYQMLLIKKAAGRRLQSLANSLNHSNLSKRITMMYKSENRAVRRMRSLALVPALVVAAIAVQQPAVATSISSAREATLLDGESHDVAFDGKVSENLSDVQTFVAMPVEETVEAESAVEAEAPVASVAQAPEMQAEAEADDKPVNSCAKMPSFPGGDRAMAEFVMRNIRYPQSSIDAGEQGAVVVRFVVGKDGKVSDATVIRGRSDALNAEALRVVSTMPDFEPGLNEEGKAVACNYTIPVMFKLKRDVKKESEKVDETVTVVGGWNDKGEGASKLTYFVNGELYSGDLKSIAPDRIAKIEVVKNNPDYPDGVVNVSLKD